jgi:hypothetical protein
MQKLKFSIGVLFLFLLNLSCTKTNNTPPANNNNNTVAAKSFMGVTFGGKNLFFSTNGSATVPMDSINAKLAPSAIDITYIYNTDYSQPGFMDPATRTKHWYWDDYYRPWLDGTKSTVFYQTTLTGDQFNNAKADNTKIGQFFSDTNVVKIAPHCIFPKGTCLGGRGCGSGASVGLGEGFVYGFKNSSGKRGFLLVRTDQSQFWPHYIIDNNTKVDIIREN